MAALSAAAVRNGKCTGAMALSDSFGQFNEHYFFKASFNMSGILHGTSGRLISHRLSFYRSISVHIWECSSQRMSDVVANLVLVTWIGVHGAHLMF